MDGFHQELAAFPGPWQSVYNDGYALDEDEAGDHEHRVPVKLERGPVPAKPLPVVEDPDEGEDHGQEADEQRRHQQPQEAPVALHGHLRPYSARWQPQELGEAAAASGYYSGPRRDAASTSRSRLRPGEGLSRGPVPDVGPPRGGQLALVQRRAPPSGSRGRLELLLRGGRPWPASELAESSRYRSG